MLKGTRAFDGADTASPIAAIPERPAPSVAGVAPAVLGGVLEVSVDDVAEARKRLVAHGCEVVKDEPDCPRCYVKDPYGLIYNLTK